MKFILRPCFEQDLPLVTLIYAHHVQTGFGTFEITPPTLDEMRARWMRVAGRGWPYFVACAADDPSRILGYAYAQPFRDREAYASTFEDSVYVAPTAIGRGIGRALLDQLLKTLTEDGVRQVVAVIGDSGNTASINVHQNLGFWEVGILRAVGKKFNRDVDVVLMQRALTST